MSRKTNYVKHPAVSRYRRVLECITDFTIIYTIIAIIKFTNHYSFIEDMNNILGYGLTPLGNNVITTTASTTLFYLVFESGLILLGFVFLPWITNGVTLGGFIFNNRFKRFDNKRLKLIDLLKRNIHIYGSFILILVISYFIDDTKTLIYPSLFVNNIDMIFTIDPKGTTFQILLIGGIISAVPFIVWFSTMFKPNQLSWTDEWAKVISTSRDLRQKSDVHLIVKYKGKYVKERKVEEYNDLEAILENTSSTKIEPVVKRESKILASTRRLAVDSKVVKQLSKPIKRKTKKPVITKTTAKKTVAKKTTTKKPATKKPVAKKSTNTKK